MDIKIQKDSKGEVSGIILTGVKFYYASIRRPAVIFDDKKKPYKEARKEYKVTIGVNEEIADAWDEMFTKQTSTKYASNAKFIEAINVEGDNSKLPDPSAKKQWTVKATQKVLKKDGSKSSPPKVMELVDGKGVEITTTKNVGNGSEGNIKLRVVKNEYGLFVYPDTIVITKLYTYEDSVGGLSKDDMSALGLDDVEYESRGNTEDDDLYSTGDAEPSEDSGSDVEDEDF